MKVAVAFREQLAAPVAQTLDLIVARINAVFLKEHTGDGQHRFPWVDIPYLAANFSADTGGAWTLTSATQLFYRYRQIGKTLELSFRFDATTVTVGPAALRLALPAGFVVAFDSNQCSLIYNDN